LRGRIIGYDDPASFVIVVIAAMAGRKAVGLAGPEPSFAKKAERFARLEASSHR